MKIKKIEVDGIEVTFFFEETGDQPLVFSRKVFSPPVTDRIGQIEDLIIAINEEVQ